MSRYRENKLKGSKFSNWNALMMLIAEARKYNDLDFNVTYLFFEQNVLANKDPVARSQSVIELERIVNIMNTIEPAMDEDYLYARMSINS